MKKCYEIDVVSAGRQYFPLAVEMIIGLFHASVHISAMLEHGGRQYLTQSRPFYLCTALARDQMFPCPAASIQCSCGQHIDSFGDHLVGCGLSSEHTRRHTALAAVIFQALLVERKP